MADVSAANGTNVTLYDESGNRVGTQANPIVSTSFSEFSRIEAKQFKDDEEIRFDIPTALPNGSIYVGVAPDNSTTSSASWTVVRTYFDSFGSPNRKRIRFGVVWDNRTSGW